MEREWKEKLSLISYNILFVTVFCLGFCIKASLQKKYETGNFLNYFYKPKTLTI